MSGGVAVVLLSAAVAAQAQQVQESYPEHPDSVPQDGVPQGKVLGPFTWKSDIFPGTVREYGIYVPAQYDPAKPACVMIVQDGIGKAKGWKLPTVLDNLIHKGDVPVQIGVFVSPGVVPALHENAEARYNRSFEYDGLGDRYARFLIEELLPHVAESYNISTDPNDCLIAGSSSGAICAFTAAWERPDRFRRVFSAVGTFVSLRGGNEYPALVRKFENRPIRVFLQDGSNDNNLYGGSWWVANQAMLSSLKFAGYDVNHAWGEGGHNGKHSTAILPDALRWLWRDYPEPITPGTPPSRRTNLIIPGEDWELVSSGHEYTDSPAANAKGDIFFADVEAGTIHHVTKGGDVSVFAKPGRGIGGLMFGPDGRLYGCHRALRQIVTFDASGQMSKVVGDAECNDLVILHDGSGYYTDLVNRDVWRFEPNGHRRLVDKGIGSPNGISVSTDQTLLFVGDGAGRFTYSFQIQKNGDLAYRQEYDHVHVRDAERASRSDGMAVDSEGRRYLATPFGLQVFDQPGRCHLIFNLPPGANWMSNVNFGGEKLDTLYVTCRDKVFRRKIAATGVLSWQAAFKPPKPRL
ncbi:gluconolactonase [bacterium]|nr:gluconolactonase [bacterium]